MMYKATRIVILMLGVVLSVITVSRCKKDDPDPEPNKPPVCVLTSPMDGESFLAGDTLLIRAEASDPDGSVSSVSFFIDNNELASLTTKPYEFAYPTALLATGSHQIKVICTDNDDASVSTKSTFYIAQASGNNPPNAIFTVTPAAGSTATIFYVNGNDSYDQEDKYQVKARWDWNDDGIWDTQYSVGKTGTHTYATTGTYTIRLEIKDSEGLTDTASHTISVGAIPFTAQPCPGLPSINYGGATYHTVLIGSQCWLRENMDIGTMIIIDTNQSNNGIIEKYCFDDLASNCIIYGGLYQWNEAMQYDSIAGAQGICPPGWHIPDDSEWKVLEGFVDDVYGPGDPEWDKENTFRGYDVGGHLKETGNTYWIGSNQGATNITGLSVRPSGGTSLQNSYGSLGTTGVLWTSSLKKPGSAWRRSFGYGHMQSFRGTGDSNENAYAVRCLKD